MYINELSGKIKKTLSKLKLNALGRALGFTKRERDMNAFQMVNTLISAMGDGNTNTLADIQRRYNILTNSSLDYKPFHNQLKKAELEALMAETAHQVLSNWVKQSYCFKEDVPFKSIKLHDGSSFAVHQALNKVYPGRFSQTSPAAVECHVTMDLLNNSIDMITVAPDTNSEHLYAPDAASLEGCLLMADAGYFSLRYLEEIDAADGHFILRMGLQMNPTVLSCQREDGTCVKLKSGISLSEVKAKKLPKRQCFDMDVQWKGKVFRVIGFWIASEKRYSFVITNLSREHYSLMQVSQLYRLRWQIELLFKELKSHNNLKKFGTRNPHIMLTLIWASICAATLKRFIVGYVERRFSVSISTLTTSKTLYCWWQDLFRALVRQRRRRLVTVIEETMEIIKTNAKTAHLNRDKKSGKFQFGLAPLFEMTTQIAQ